MTTNNSFKFLFKSLSLILLSLFLFITTFNSQAHILTNAINSNSILGLKDSKIEVEHLINFPYTELDNVYKLLDKDGDRLVSQQEESQLLEYLQTHYFLIFNTSSNLEDLDKLVFPTLILKIEFELPQKNFKNLSINNRIEIESSLENDWVITEQEASELKLVNPEYYPDKTLVSKAIKPPVEFLKLNSNNLEKKPLLINTNLDKLKEFLKQPNYSPFALASLLFACLVFGVIHSFQPGHGKAIISTYLLAIKGGFKDSLVVSLSATISHTLVIILLAVLWALFKDGLSFLIPLSFWGEFKFEISKVFFNPIWLSQILKNLGALLLILSGLYLAFKYYQQYLTYKLTKKFKNPNPNHYQTPINTDLKFNQKITVLDHGDHKHFIPLQKINLKESIFLGLSTGLTPCLDAFLILSLSISLGLGWLGVIMLVFFSCGLGASLAVVGFLSSKAFKTFRLDRFELIALLSPLLSALLLVALGVYQLTNR
jgi:nickel/cobalt transporter (NicO) family protein